MTSNEVYLYIVLATNFHLYLNGELKDFIVIKIII